MFGSTRGKRAEASRRRRVTHSCSPVMMMVVDDTGDDGPSTAPLRRRQRRRGRGGGATEGGTAVPPPPPLSMTWPSGCALDWEERQRIGQAALQRCSQTATTAAVRGSDGGPSVGVLQQGHRLQCFAFTVATGARISKC